MQLIAPDILKAAHGLSLWLCITGLVVGLLLWLTGWLGHRFWIVLVTTVLAGIVGIISAHTPWNNMKPLVSGLLLAIAAGVLALALVRLVVFAAGGGAACLAVHAFAPAGWQEPLGWFLVGGLIGLLLFRLWTMVLTSFAGTMLSAYSLLFLLDTLGKVDAITLAERKASLLNGACLGLMVIGVILQFLLDRRRIQKQREKEEQVRELAEREQDRLSRRRGWFQWGQPYRRAG